MLGDQSNGLRSAYRRIPALAIVAACGLLSCGRQAPPMRAFAARPECPDTSALTMVDSQGRVVNVLGQVPLSEPITDIPEFNDCQRFIAGDRYDSLYAIFAAFRLESLTAKLHVADSLAKMGGAAYGTVPVATIYSFGGHYPSLGIEPGFNCLFLYRVGGAWSAKMVPWAGSTDPDCGDQRFDPLSRGTLLTVSQSPLDAGLSDADYPPVARWDRDDASGQYYIGIKCEAAWCAVAPAGTAVSFGWLGADPPFDGLPPAPKPRVTRVRGWYDTQVLADVGGGTLRPGSVRGTMVPHPAIDRLPITAYAHRWVHVADAIVDGAYKWLERGTNRVYSCHGAAVTGCAMEVKQARTIGSATPIPVTSCPADPDVGEPWWTKVVEPSGTVFYLCETRHNHAAQLQQYIGTHPKQLKITIPGAARWRWLYNDEGGWFKCPTGCCTPN